MIINNIAYEILPARRRFRKCMQQMWAKEYRQEDSVVSIYLTGVYSPRISLTDISYGLKN